MTDQPNPPPDGEARAREALRAMEHGSSGSAADLAVEGRPKLQDRLIETPYARPAEPLGDGEPVDQLAEKKQVVGDAREARLDETVEESFPASDPPSFQSRSG